MNKRKTEACWSLFIYLYCCFRESYAQSAIPYDKSVLHIKILLKSIMSQDKLKDQDCDTTTSDVR